MEIVGGGLAAIGNTPLVRLARLVPEDAAEVWVKLEGGNPTGSYKDRMAISVLMGALERGDVASGDTVVEFTSYSHARQVVNAWRNDYNTHRPHSSLAELTPIQFATRSETDHNRNRANL